MEYRYTSTNKAQKESYEEQSQQSRHSQSMRIPTQTNISTSSNNTRTINQNQLSSANVPRLEETNGLSGSQLGQLQENQKTVSRIISKKTYEDLQEEAEVGSLRFKFQEEIFQENPQNQNLKFKFTKDQKRTDIGLEHPDFDQQLYNEQSFSQKSEEQSTEYSFEFGSLFKAKKRTFDRLFKQDSSQKEVSQTTKRLDIIMNDIDVIKQDVQDGQVKMTLIGYQQLTSSQSYSIKALCVTQQLLDQHILLINQEKKNGKTTTNSYIYDCNLLLTDESDLDYELFQKLIHSDQMKELKQNRDKYSKVIQGIKAIIVKSNIEVEDNQIQILHKQYTTFKDNNLKQKYIDKILNKKKNTDQLLELYKQLQKQVEETNLLKETLQTQLITVNDHLKVINERIQSHEFTQITFQNQNIFNMIKQEIHSGNNLGIITQQQNLAKLSSIDVSLGDIKRQINNIEEEKHNKIQQEPNNNDQVVQILQQAENYILQSQIQLNYVQTNQQNSYEKFKQEQLQKLNEISQQIQGKEANQIEEKNKKDFVIEELSKILTNINNQLKFIEDSRKENVEQSQTKYDQLVQNIESVRTHIDKQVQQTLDKYQSQLETQQESNKQIQKDRQLTDKLNLQELSQIRKELTAQQKINQETLDYTKQIDINQVKEIKKIEDANQRIETKQLAMFDSLYQKINQQSAIIEKQNQLILESRDEIKQINKLYSKQQNEFLELTNKYQLQQQEQTQRFIQLKAGLDQINNTQKLCQCQCQAKISKKQEQLVLNTLTNGQIEFVQKHDIPLVMLMSRVVEQNSYNINDPKGNSKHKS